MSVYQITYGQPEKFVPSAFSQTSRINVEKMQAPAEIAFKTTPAGCVLEFPLKAGSEVYGFGLQLKGFAQRSRKKITRPNADPPSNTGDSHAPVPFFVTTEGWGVFIDTARYAQ
ncbi:MAG TPA: glycoside hydrolase, partial [Bacillota bacterium]|nr:glycoside hydrolase [Bacillota bacterium]